MGFTYSSAIDGSGYSLLLSYDAVMAEFYGDWPHRAAFNINQNAVFPLDREESNWVEIY